jgi:hypothetical protein
MYDNISSFPITALKVYGLAILHVIHVFPLKRS